MLSTAGGEALGLSGQFPVTLVGSFPLTDVREATRIVAGELPDMPLLPEFPGRGPGADIIGRTLALLSEVGSEFASTTTPDGWRVSGSVSGAMPKAMRLGQAFLREDLDACEEAMASYQGLFKVQLAGPMTLAAAVELPNGEPLLADLGAVRELVSATNMAATSLAAECVRRIPGARVVVQFDEPLLDRVIGGLVRSQSGIARIIREPSVTAVHLATMASIARSETLAGVGVHTCASHAPLVELAAAGFDLISADFLALARTSAAQRSASETALAEFAEAGGVLGVGLAANADTVRERVAPFADFCQRTGLDPASLAHLGVITPRCGLADLQSLDSVRATIDNLREVQRALLGEYVGEARE